MSNRTFDNESDIIGLSCTLSTAYKGYTEGVIVDDYGTTIVVRLESGKEISVFRDEIIFMIKQYGTDSNKIRPMGCSGAGDITRQPSV